MTTTEKEEVTSKVAVWPKNYKSYRRLSKTGLEFKTLEEVLAYEFAGNNHEDGDADLAIRDYVNRLDITKEQKHAAGRHLSVNCYGMTDEEYEASIITTKHYV